MKNKYNIWLWLLFGTILLSSFVNAGTWMTYDDFSSSSLNGSLWNNTGLTNSSSGGVLHIDGTATTCNGGYSCMISRNPIYFASGNVTKARARVRTNITNGGGTNAGIAFSIGNNDGFRASGEYGAQNTSIFHLFPSIDPATSYQSQNGVAITSIGTYTAKTYTWYWYEIESLGNQTFLRIYNDSGGSVGASTYNSSASALHYFSGNYTYFSFSDWVNSGYGWDIDIVEYYVNQSDVFISVINPSSSGTSNNTQINISLNCTKENATYDLWFDNSSTPTTKILNNNTNKYWLTNVTTSGTYYFFARCLYNETYSINSSTLNWTYDITFPTITLNNNNNFFKTNNNSNINQYSNNLTINLTFSDNHQLYAFEINITKNGTTYFNITNSSLSGTSYTYYNWINTTTWESGVYNITLFVSDSHTDKEIENYNVTETKDKIKFKTQTNNEISLYTDEESTIKANKKKDRYSINVNFKTKYQKDRLFHLTSTTCPLDYIEDSSYKAHFVSLCSKDGNWFDFEGLNGQAFVNKINDYHYTIYFTNLENDVTLNSIGGLNIYSANFTWYRGNATYNNQSYFVNETKTFYINLTFNSSFISDINATFIYNLSSKTTYKTNTSTLFLFNSSISLPQIEGTYNASWNITILQNDGTNYNFVLNFTHYVYDFYFDNCSSSNMISIYLEYFNESTPTQIQNNSLEAYIKYWIINPELAKYTNLTFSSNITHSICIYPNTSIFADAYFKYNNGVYIHRYYLLNQTLNNATTNLHLYNIDSTSGISILKLTTRRVNDYNYYKNVVTSLQRFYVGEGVWRTIQMDESGDFGIINFDILERNTDYKLIFIDRATTNILKISESMKFICSSGLCDLTYLLNPDTATSSENEITKNVSVNTTTKIINVSWIDTSGITQIINLKVWKNTITGITTICDITQTANAGNIGCNASNYSGSIYVNLKQDNNLIFGENYELSQNKLSSYLPTGEGGFISMLIYVLCVTFGLFSPVGAIITGVFGLIVIYMLGIFNPLTFTGLIIATIIGALIGFKVKN